MSENVPSTSGLSTIDLSKLPRGAISMRGMPLSRTARLPSIKGPRDLTLGSSGKRVFTPNIPVRREKKAPQPNLNSSRLSKQQTASQSNRENRTRGRGKKAFVQTPGAVFGDGVGNIPKPSSFKDLNCTSVSSLQKPILKPNAVMKIERVDADDEAELSDKFVDDSDLGEEDESMSPVSLPLSGMVCKKDMVKKEPLPLDEPQVNNNLSLCSKIKKEPGTEAEEITFEPEMLEKLTLKPESNALYLLEFPDYFLSSGQIATSCDIPNERHDVPNIESTSGKNTWPHVEEGCIGKLQFLRNGKCRLLVGKYIFEVTGKPLAPYLQQLVAMTTLEDHADMSLLGNIKQGARFLPTINTIETKCSLQTL